MSPQEETPHTILRAIWRAQMHVEPHALDRSPPAVQRRLEHVWVPSELLIERLSVFPAGWLRLWRDCGRGHVVFTDADSRYAPGPQPWRDGALECVCYLAMEDMLDDPTHALVQVAHLLDHLLGSGAATDGPWFSDGAGLYQALAEAAQRFVAINALGYGHRELGATNAHDYYARTLTLYLENPHALNILDPQVERLYRHALFSDSFWCAVEGH